MLAFPSMLLSAADQAGISHPPEDEVDLKDVDPDKYPHWYVLCLTQLCRPMHHGEHFENAKALGKIPEDKLRKMTIAELEAAGCYARRR